MSSTNEFIQRSFTGILLVITFGGSYLHSQILFSLLLCAVLIEILIVEWPKLIPYKSIQNIFFTILFPIVPFGSLLYIVNSYYHSDIYLPLYPFLVCWTADSCGYFIGKVIGKHKIYPSISPGKSWEGLIGSIVGVFILNILVLSRIKKFSLIATSHPLLMFIFSACMAILTLIGGFFMSFLKRRKNLKDTGDLLPGHGGLLDRFDSVLVIAMATAVLTLLL